MNCSDAQRSLLELLDVELPQQEAALLRQHLETCETCRAEFRALAEASRVLKDALGELAPDSRYLTDGRWKALMAACARHSKPRPVFARRRVVAAAAAAAILVSALFLYWEVRIILDGRAPLPPAGERRTAQDTTRVPVTLASAEAESPVYVVRGYRKDPGPTMVHEARMLRRAPECAELISLDQPDIWVPADNAYYDSTESARWW